MRTGQAVGTAARTLGRFLCMELIGVTVDDDDLFVEGVEFYNIVCTWYCVQVSSLYHLS